MQISYNKIGLPKAITDDNDVPKVSYIYDALDRKLTKAARTTEIWCYIGGVEYTDSGSGAAIDLIPERA